MFFIVARKPWEQAYRDYSLVLVSSFAMIAVAPLLLLSTVIADRFGYYLVPIQCVIFARLPYLALGRYRPLYSVLPYFGLLALFTYWTLNSYHFNQCYVPYQSWLFGLPEGSY